ncbi:MAG: DNA polymerase III subunit gamma/tau [Verrucomicrobiota bacterium]|nr:DNA polymerase III subunit gamma/tau [Verrucomicrobiota bacterium]
MSYEVFARKYRPQTFDDLVGQNHVSRTLKNAVEQNRLAHAYLFVGPRGTGKTSTARILAKALNCTNAKAPTIEPCGKCDNCKEIAAGNNLDVLEIDGASNNGVEQVRELRDNVRYAPAQSRFKIYIIDEVHMLSSAAFNALLKTLEEPPPHVKFIFATTEPQKVLATILSRCQRFDLHRIATNLIAEQLQKIARNEKLTLEPAAAHAIARGAEGGMRDAESMLDQLVAFCGNKIAEADVLSVFGFTSEQTVADLIGKILRGETADALQLLHDQGESGKDMMKLMSDSIAHLRDLLVFKVKPDALSDETTEEMRAAFAGQSSQVETDRVLELVDQFAVAEGRMKWAPNKKLHFEVAIIRAIQTLNQATLDDVIENLSALQSGNAAPALKKTEPKKTPARAAQTPILADTITKAADEPVDAAAIWRKAIAEIKTRRPFIKAWIAQAHPLGASGKKFELGFARDQEMVMEHLSSRSNREFLEALLADISDREWTIQFTLKDDLPAVADDAPPLVKEALEMFGGELT